MHSSDQSSQKFWGLLKWKERWGLSWRGWLLLTLLGLASASLLFVNVHPFLAVTRRVDTNNLVVEEWIQRYAFRAAVKEFNSGSYEHIFTTGGPENGSGGYVNDYQTSASVGAAIVEAIKATLKAGAHNLPFSVMPATSRVPFIGRAIPFPNPGLGNG